MLALRQFQEAADAAIITNLKHLSLVMFPVPFYLLHLITMLLKMHNNEYYISIRQIII